MTIGLDVLLMGMGAAAGAMGGLAAAISLQNDGFKKSPKKGASLSTETVRAQRFFFWSRVIYGGILGAIVTLPFVDSVMDNGLSVLKLAFIQAVTGMNSPTVAALGKVVAAKIKAIFGE